MSHKKRRLECEEKEGDFPAAKRGKVKSNGEGNELSEDASVPLSTPADIALQLLNVEEAMCKALSQLSFPAPVTHIYNPLDYAANTHSTYVKNYGNGVKKILFLGMNPGPFGMAQNGVAFGDTEMVQNWLGISGTVGKPEPEHPSRIIHGLACPKAEVSGSRFWGLFRDLCGTPIVFFKNCFVHNYCPFCFMNKTGKNITPPSLKAQEKTQLQEICDGALFEVIELMQVDWVVGIGKYGADRAKAALKSNYLSATAANGGNAKKGSYCKKSSNGVETFTVLPCGGDSHGIAREVHVCSIMHPSPINPATHKGWADIVTAQLKDFGLLDIITAIEK